MEQANDERTKVTRVVENDTESPEDFLLESSPVEREVQKLGSCNEYLEEGDEICYYDKVFFSPCGFVERLISA